MQAIQAKGRAITLLRTILGLCVIDTGMSDRLLFCLFYFSQCMSVTQRNEKIIWWIELRWLPDLHHCMQRSASRGKSGRRSVVGSHLSLTTRTDNHALSLQVCCRVSTLTPLAAAHQQPYTPCASIDRAVDLAIFRQVPEEGPVSIISLRVSACRCRIFPPISAPIDGSKKSIAGRCHCVSPLPVNDLSDSAWVTLFGGRVYC